MQLKAHLRRSHQLLRRLPPALLVSTAVGAAAGALLMLCAVSWTSEQGRRVSGAQCMKLAGLLRTDDPPPTTCRSAASRGPNQRVLAFSFYGDARNHRGYYQGIWQNARLVPALYPGWVMRLYHEERPDGGPVAEALLQLNLEFPHLDLCYAGDLPFHINLTGASQMLWRLLPAVDPLVDVFVARDLDSRLSAREAAAVRSWLGSGLAFHVMRDHPQHLAAIMGGMWGARPDLRRALLRYATAAVLACAWGNPASDQDVLHAFLWPVMKGDVLQHDSYYCDVEWFAQHGNVTAFPTRREGRDFVGSPEPSDGDDALEAPPCRPACRPRGRRHWIYC